MQKTVDPSIARIQVLHYLLAIIVAVFGLRLFYVQVIKHDIYQEQAQANQLKQYEIPSTRGGIYAYDGDEIVPLVLNEIRYRIVADPELIVDPSAAAIELAKLLDLDAGEIEDRLKADTRYSILASKQTKDVKNKVQQLKLPGIFTNEKTPLRVYLQGDIAGQLLGFVNDSGEGSYGIEQALNDRLTGTPGRVKALTDQNNVPLLASGDNVLVDAINGDDVLLSIDVSMQRQAEDLLEHGLKRAVADTGSVIILDPNTGAVKAMANYPSYDPALFAQVEDPGLFNNPAVNSPLEPGSVMKVLTAAAALDSDSVTENQSYFDPSFYKIDGATVRNIAEDGGAATRSVSDILEYSLNTGATWLLMQMGDGQLNEKGRKVWHDYMANKYHFGQPTGIEQGTGYEAGGVVPDPVEGFGLNIRYANTAFGQGMTVTPLQMSAAVASIVNGGTYYAPRLQAGTLDAEGVPTLIDPIKVSRSVSAATSDVMVGFMNNIVESKNKSAVRSGYQVGGKTGTAEFAAPGGGYYEDRFNGTYVGYVGGDRPEYIIMIRVDDPRIAGYAGSRAAGPLFTDISNMLIDNFTVPRLTN